MEIWKEKDMVIVKTSYSAEIVESLRQIGQGKWSKDREAWIFPMSKWSQLSALKTKYIKDKQPYKFTTQNFEPNPKKYESFNMNADDFSKMRAYMIQAGYSEQTRKNYISHIRRFLEFSKGSADEIWINAYMVELLETKKSSHAYCNQAVNAIKLFLKHNGRGSKDVLTIVRPKKEKKLPKVLSKAEIKILFDATLNLKHRCALMLGYSCGMRVSEVANLKVMDLHVERLVVNIKQSKGRKDRSVPLSIKMVDELERYKKQYRPYEWLFENPTRDGPIHARTLQNVFNESVRKAGITQHATFHSLRHSYATHLMESGVDIRIIQELLGHASSKTTEIYTHVSRVTLQNIQNPLDDL